MKNTNVDAGCVNAAWLRMRARTAHVRVGAYCLVALSGLALASGGGAFAADTTGVDLPVNAAVIPPPCQIGLTGNDGANVKFAEINASEFVNAPSKTDSTQIQQLTLKLSQCGGDFYGSRTPSITVSGATAAVDGVSYGNMIFRDADSTAKGVGFELRFNDGNVSWSGSSSHEANVKDQGVFTTKDFPAGWNNSVDIPIAIRVTNGSYASSAFVAGTLTSTISFTFEYK